MLCDERGETLSRGEILAHPLDSKQEDAMISDANTLFIRVFSLYPLNFGECNEGIRTVS